eukprot:Nk52_evm1s2168 gene=Nk52_evmTU1s2168
MPNAVTRKNGVAGPQNHHRGLMYAGENAKNWFHYVECFFNKTACSGTEATTIKHFAEYLQHFFRSLGYIPDFMFHREIRADAADVRVSESDFCSWLVSASLDYSSRAKNNTLLVALYEYSEYYLLNLDTIRFDNVTTGLTKEEIDAIRIKTAAVIQAELNRAEEVQANIDLNAFPDVQDVFPSWFTQEEDDKDEEALPILNWGK